METTVTDIRGLLPFGLLIRVSENFHTDFVSYAGLNGSNTGLHVLNTSFVSNTDLIVLHTSSNISNTGLHVLNTGFVPKTGFISNTSLHVSNIDECEHLLFFSNTDLSINVDW